ncbi:DUF732 domain-containing protein [Streptomyces sp. NPDC057950]|uniref:DUF732 domain-containing protein n=1 Tax=Streptomyces sp. NPDC057950 TaxID=3346288 RepID=UPI0036EAA7AD
MKHPLTAAATLLLATLTACSAADTTSTDDTPAKAHKQAADASQAAMAQARQFAYLLTVRKKVPALADTSDKRLLEVGNETCDSIDKGTSVLEIAATHQTALGITSDDSGYVVGAAINGFCPEHLDEIGAAP